MYYEKQCHTFNEDTRSTNEILNKLEGDVAQIMLNQKKMHKMLASLIANNSISEPTTTVGSAASELTASSGNSLPADKQEQ